MFRISSVFHKHYMWLYFAVFLLLWTVRELWLVEFLSLIDSEVLLTIVKAAIKIIIWVVPVFLIVRFVEQREPASYLRLRQNVKVGMKWAAWVSLALVIYFSLQSLVILHNGMSFDLGLDQWVNTIILVGFIEEVVFRAFILRKLMDQFQFWQANLMTAVLFLSIHFPIWFYKGLFSSPSILVTFVNVIIVGLIFGYIYKKTNSLWSVIIIHSVYNLLVSIFI